MPIAEVKYKDEDGFHYKYPDRSCHRCQNYPCIPNMEKLKGNYASYGCKLYLDINSFDVWKPKK